MKKTISVVAVLALITTSTFSSVSAMMGVHDKGEKMSMTNIKMEGKKMEGENMMKNMMSQEMMEKRNAIMKEISDSLNDDGKISLEEMKKSHMSDMMIFMNQFSDSNDMSAKKIAREEMKKKHFADLKAILKDNSDLYIKISTKMEKLMMEMMKNIDKDGMGEMKMGGMKHNMKMGINKKRMFSAKTKSKIDNLIIKLFSRLDKLDDELKNKKIDSIISKIKKAKNKYSNLESEKKVIIIDILDYLIEKLIEKESDGIMGGMDMGFMNGDMGKKVETSILMKYEKNLMKAKKVEIVELADGDVYIMEVTKVEKEIGNAKVVMLAYNGSIPGPVIKVKKDSQVTIKFINKVKGLETTLHSHGLRLDNKMDGVPEMTQDVIKYGDTFEYKLDFVDEGVYWYHPHVREDLQQELGLYGNYIVDPVETTYWSKVNREETMILDDILLENGKILGMSDQFANYVMMGRFGNTMLINGETNYNLNVKKGESIRMYFTNVANTRVFQVAIPGAKMKLVGGDIGKYEREEMIDSFIMAPAERYIVDIYFEKSGKFDILNKNPEFTKKLGTITVNEERIDVSYKSDFDILRVNEDVISDIDDFRKYFDTKPDKYLDLSVGMKGQKAMKVANEGDGDKIEWSDTMGKMNEMSNSDTTEWKIIERETGKENMDIDWNFKVGDKVKIRIFNDPNSMHPMQHPIHFHGQRFLVVSENGKTPDNMVWKDTSMVKTGEYIDIVMDITNPGEWMAHCHIAEHLSAGMMMSFKVEE